MASNKSTLLALVFLAFCVGLVYSTDYILGELNKCRRVPNESPCNIPFDYFVPDYASRRFYILMETIYRKAKDISRLDSRAQCVDAYKAFLCSQLFPRCSKHQNRRFYNLEMKRWIIHDSGIRTKCNQIFAACNKRVSERFISSEYFLCDYLSYTPDGWESDRCITYDVDTRCPAARYSKLPLWYLNYHDQNLVEYLNATQYRLNHTLPSRCRLRLLNILCRHPTCSEDAQYFIVNYTRQECNEYLECARFVPGEINVDAICLLFPSFSMSSTASALLVLIAFFFQRFLVIF